MAALPYIQLYVADYLADTMHLTTEEHGAYLLLIMNYWQTGKPIPKKRLASVVRLSNERWNCVKDALNEFFTEGQQGEWIHDRLEQDLDKVKSKSNKASKAGKASAAKRAATKVIENKENFNERSTHVQRVHSESLNHTDTDTDTDVDIKEKDLCNSEQLNLFDLFWDNYPRKQDKKKSRVAFKRLNKSQKQLAIDDCKTRYANTEKQFIPLATTYIRGERWEDEQHKTDQQRGDKHNGFSDRDYSSGATPTKSIAWFDESLK